MIDKLKSRLNRKEKGFTLIELLVVIAIIAILVLIVVVAINPAERLREAADRAAASNARSAGTLIETCIARNQGNLGVCNSVNGIETGGDGNIPEGIAIAVSQDQTNVCASDEGRTSSTQTFWIYETDTGEVASAAAVSCPDPT